jgi:hypothetical protein
LKAITKHINTAVLYIIFFSTLIFFCIITFYVLDTILNLNQYYTTNDGIKTISNITSLATNTQQNLLHAPGVENVRKTLYPDGNAPVTIEMLDRYIRAQNHFIFDVHQSVQQSNQSLGSLILLSQAATITIILGGVYLIVKYTVVR